jgi:Leucine-rich repeat (LRR) protein
MKFIICNLLELQYLKNLIPLLQIFKEAVDLDKQLGLIEEANAILKKCNGLPLAIVTIGGFLAKQPKTPMEWRKLNEHISVELAMNPELGIIRTILMKSYDGLPYHLKSCFLYMSIFPEDYNISRRRLVHRWNVEGYSSEVRGKSIGEVADGYFMELIDRSMTLPVKASIGSRKGISSCKLHDLMREISISKAMEENLVFRMEEGCNSNTQGTIRHLAISSNWEGDQSEFESTVDLSRIRSLTVFGKWKPFYISDKMRLLRVLDLESTTGLVDHHLEAIGKLLHLKYLSLRGCAGIFHLPDSVGNPKQLQTVDITQTQIIKLPQTIIKLRKLQYLRAGGGDQRILNTYSYDRFLEINFPEQMQNKLCVWSLVMLAFCLSSCSLEVANSFVGIVDDDNLNRRDVCTFWCSVVFPFIARFADPCGVVAPRGLRRLKALHTLGVVNIARGKAMLQDIKMLTRLRKLAVSGINKKNCQEFCSTLAHLSQLESLSVQSVQEEGLRGCLDGLRCPPKSLQSLKLDGALGELPEWVAELHYLVKLKLEYTILTEVDGNIEVLGKLPNLAILRLLKQSFKADEGSCCFTCCREAFPSLTVLELGYGSGIRSAEFEEGTAPNLELLCSNDERISFSGLSSLRSLKEVLIDKMEHTAESMEDLRAQLTRNPNKPVLKFK